MILLFLNFYKGHFTSMCVFVCVVLVGKGMGVGQCIPHHDWRLSGLTVP